ncbi:hypothetical protein FB33_2656, partial [Cutibacterium acnes]
MVGVGKFRRLGVGSRLFSLLGGGGGSQALAGGRAGGGG